MPGQVRRRFLDILASFAVMFAAVTLGTLQFIQHSLPSPDTVRVPTTATVYALQVGILVPTLLLTTVDRLLAWKDTDGRRVRRFRIGVFTVAGVLFFRQLQLYFGPVELFFSPFEGIPLLALIVFAACAAGIAWACSHWYKEIAQYFVYAAPVALVLLVLAVVDMAPARQLPDGYADEVTSGEAGDGPPVFVLAYDEMAFRLVAGEDGLPNAAMYPNLAALAGDGMWFTNATTNQFHTPFVIPPLVEGTAGLMPEYDLTLYDQFAFSEQILWDELRDPVHVPGDELPGRRRLGAREPVVDPIDLGGGAAGGRAGAGGGGGGGGLRPRLSAHGPVGDPHVHAGPIRRVPWGHRR